MSNRKVTIYTVIAFCFLLFALGYPLYSLFVAKGAILGVKTNPTTYTGTTKFLPWNNFRKSSNDLYYTFIKCTAQKKAAASAPHTVIATFYGAGSAFSTELTFTAKEASFGTGKIAGFDAKGISDTSAGYVLLEMGSDEIDCNTSIYHNRVKNSQLFSEVATTNAIINFDYDGNVLINEAVNKVSADGEVLDSKVTVSPMLYVQNLSDKEAKLSVETFQLDGAAGVEQFTIPDGSDLLPAFGYVTIPINGVSAYQLKLVPTEGDDEIKFISFIEYPAGEDMTAKEGHLLRRYIQAYPQNALHTVTLPFNRENGFVTSIYCKASSKIIVTANFVNGSGETYIGLSKSRNTAKRLTEFPNFTKYIKARTAGIIKINVPNNETVCSSIIRLSNTTDQYEFFEKDKLYGGASFVNNKEEPIIGSEGKLYIYNLSEKDANFEVYNIAEESLIEEALTSISVPAYGVGTLEVGEINEQKGIYVFADFNIDEFVNDHSDMRASLNLDMIDLSQPVTTLQEDLYPSFFSVLQYKDEDGNTMYKGLDEDGFYQNEEDNNKQECCPEGYELYTGFDACREQAGNENGCDVSMYEDADDTVKENVSCCVKKDECFCQAPQVCTSDEECCGGACLMFEDGKNLCSVPLCQYGAPCQYDNDCSSGSLICKEGKCEKGFTMTPSLTDNPQINGKVVDCIVAKPVHIPLQGENHYYNAYSAAPKYTANCEEPSGLCHICFYEDLDANTGKVYQCEDEQCKCSEYERKMIAAEKTYIKKGCNNPNSSPKCLSLFKQMMSYVVAREECSRRFITRDEEGLTIERCDYGLNSKGETVCVNRWGLNCLKHAKEKKYLISEKKAYSTILGEEKYNALRELYRLRRDLYSHYDNYEESRKEFCTKLSNFMNDEEQQNEMYEWCMSDKTSDSDLRKIVYDFVHPTIYRFQRYYIQKEVERFKKENPSCTAIDIDIVAHGNPELGQGMGKLVLACSDEQCTVCCANHRDCSVLRDVDDVLDRLKCDDDGESECEKLQKLLSESGKERIEIVGNPAFMQDYVPLPSYTIVVTSKGCEIKWPSCNEWVNQQCMREKEVESVKCQYNYGGRVQNKKLCCRKFTVKATLQTPISTVFQSTHENQEPNTYNYTYGKWELRNENESCQ